MSSKARRRLQSAVSTLTMLDKLKKKREGTPDKSGTPSTDAVQDENSSQLKNVIWNEEIEKLQIKPEELSKVREPRPPDTDRKTPVTERLTVRRMKPASEINKPKPKLVTVSKPAPPDAEIKPMEFSGFAGPRYDEAGSVIAHSILGNYDDFKQEAIGRGDLQDIPDKQVELPMPDVPTLKYEKKRRKEVNISRTDESKALHNWQMKMIERKKQQGHISRLLQKKPEDLAMNQADNFRSIQEDRYIINRTIPAVDYGKGYRVGSEFWKQQERFGDDITGVHMTLTQTEKGYPTPIEHVGLSKKIRDEKGWHWAPSHTRPMHYPWHKAPYLDQRRKQLQPYIDELDPHRPDFDGLEVVGTSNPYGNKENDTFETDQDDYHRLPEMGEEEGDEADVTESGDQLQTDTETRRTPVFGPSIQFAGQAARWTGDSYSFKSQVGIEARVNFETYSGDRVTSYLTVINDGTTSIYYDWKKMPKDNPFDLVQSNVQRFYFNNSSGVVLPGETIKFPFVFKSPNAGVFTEQWKFETSPVVCGGAELIVTLRGIALQEDKFKKQREQVQAELMQKESEQLVRHLLDEIIGGLKVQERPKSPIDAYITEEEIFARCNPRLHYHHDAVQELKTLYTDMVDEEERDGRFWDLSVTDLRDELMCLDEDDERKETFLHQLNTAVSKMSFTPHKPVQKQLYKAGYQLMLEAVDNIVSQSALVRQVMGLPEKEMDDFNDDKSRNDSRTPSRKMSKTPNPRLSSEPSDLRESDDSQNDTTSALVVISEGRGKKSAADKGKAADKKAATPTPAKDAKGGKLSKESTKADLKSKAGTPAPKPPPSRGRTTMSTLGDREQTGASSPVVSEDPVVNAKYKQKLYAQAYIILGDTIDKMATVFDDIIQKEDRPPLQP